MMPGKRVEHLVDEALRVQREACMFHNSLNTALCLCTDHRCGRYMIPTKTLQVLSAHEDAVWCVHFSHNGKYLASGCVYGTAIIWEVVRDDYVRVKHTLKRHREGVRYVAWSPDDTMLLTCGSDEMVKLWDVQTGEWKHTCGGKLSAWFPDGKRFATAGADGRIHIWDLEGKEIDVWGEPRTFASSDIAITRDGTHLVSISGWRIRIHDIELQVERVIQEESKIWSLSVSKDGRYLLVSLNDEMHLWDVTEDDDKTSKKAVKYRGHRVSDYYIVGACFGGSDEAFVVSGSDDCHVYIWHRGNGELLDVLPGHDNVVTCVSWNPVNPHMFASGSEDTTIRVWGLNESRPGSEDR